MATLSSPWALPLPLLLVSVTAPRPRGSMVSTWRWSDSLPVTAATTLQPAAPAPAHSDRSRPQSWSWRGVAEEAAGDMSLWRPRDERGARGSERGTETGRAGPDQGSTRRTARATRGRGRVVWSRTLIAGTTCTNTWSRPATPRTRRRGPTCWRVARASLTRSSGGTFRD